MLDRPVTVEVVQDSIDVLRSTGTMSGYIRITRKHYNELVEDMKLKGYKHFDSLDGFRFEVERNG